jgi:K+ transporter
MGRIERSYQPKRAQLGYSAAIGRYPMPVSVMRCAGRTKSRSCDAGTQRSDPMQLTDLLSRAKIVPGTRPHGTSRWRDRLFAAMARNAGTISDFFNIPTNRLVELGTRVKI